MFVLRASGETPVGGAHCCFYHLQPKHKPSRRHHHCTKKCVVTVVSVLYECLWSYFLVMKLGGQCIKDRKCLFARTVHANFGLIAHSPVYSIILLKLENVHAYLVFVLNCTYTAHTRYKIIE